MQYKDKEKGKNKSQRNKELASIKNLLQKGNIPTATSEIIKYVEKYPDDEFGLFQYGKILLRNNRIQEAKEIYQKTANLYGKNRQSALIALGEIATLERKFKLACKYFKEAMETDCYDNGRAAFLLVRLTREMGYYYEALQLLDEIHSFAPEMQIERAKILTAIDMNEEADKVLSTLIPKNKLQEREIAVEKGKIYKARGDYEQAQIYYEFAKDTDVKDKLYYQALMEQARLAKQTSNYQQLVIYGEELYNADRTFNGNANIMLGIGKLGIGEYQSAKNIFELALEVNDYSCRSQATYYLSSLQILSGEEKNAEKTLRNYIENNKVADRLSYIKLIKLLLDQNRLDEARTLLNEIEQKDKNSQDDYSFIRLRLLLDKKQGKILPKREENEYVESQIIEYNKEEAILSTKKYHQTLENDESRFKESIDIEALFQELQVYLTDENKLSLGLLDEYEIPYPNAGYRGNEIYDHIRIIVIPGTKNIISMYPCAKSPLPTKGEYQKSQEQNKKIGQKKSTRFEKFFGQTSN